MRRSRRPHSSATCRGPLVSSSAFSRARARGLLATTLLLVAASLPITASPLAGQEEPATEEPDTTNDALKVFLDCQTFSCDRTFIRTEVDFVDWVRDRQDAQVHVIVTSQASGGGIEFNIDLIGREAPLEDREDQITFASSSTDTQSERLDGVSRAIAVGLARFSQLAGFGGFEISAVEEQQARGQVQIEEDPWDLWVFEVRGTGSLSGEESQRRRSIRGSLSAERTTEEWNVEIEGSGRFSRSEFDLNDSTTFVNKSTNWEFSTSLVNSIADRWSVGGTAGVSRSTFTNRDLSVRVGPAVEWSFFPYEEANRRRLIAFYQLGLEYNDYEEKTIFFETSELLFRESLTLSYRAREPWGEGEAAIEASHFFDSKETGEDGSELLWRLELDSELDFRITRGFSFNVEGRAAWTRDQFFLSAEGASDEEILVQRRELASDFEWNVELGFSFTFGSIYNTIVNNRFPEVFGFGGFRGGRF